MIPTLNLHAEDYLWKKKWDTAPAQQRAAITVLRYLYAMARDFFSGQLTMRAMSLVYTTLLSVVPLLAFSFSLLKGFGVHRKLEPVLLTFLEPLGPKGAEITERLIALVDNVRGDWLATFGLAFLFFTVISMVQKIEESFNYVWQVEIPRSFARRFTEYVSVLLVGPVLMVVAMGTIASISSTALVQKITAIQPFGEWLLLIGKSTPYVAVIIVFTFLYAFIPNTRVQLRAALVGGLTAGVMWAAMSVFFASVVAGSPMRLAIYAGFAIGIVILIWLYLNWIILLVGAQLSFYVQHPEYLRSGRARIDLPNRQREMLALLTMQIAGKAFLEGREGPNVDQLAPSMGLPASVLAPVLRQLEESRLLRATEDQVVVPARSMDRITLQDIVNSVRDYPSDAVPSHADLEQIQALLAQVDGAIERSMGGRTLRDLVGERQDDPSESCPPVKD